MPRAVPDARFLLDDFERLGAAQLYACLRLRSEVFVVEQRCVYQDLDGLDAASLHLRRVAGDGRLLAYARLLPVGVDFPESCSIGRIATAPAARGKGHGRALVLRALRECRGRWPGARIRIRAQTYLLRFYTELGFAPEGEVFLEDGIPHQEMCFAGRPSAPLPSAG